MYCDVLGFSGISWDVLDVLVCTGMYWDVLGCTGMYRDVLGCSGMCSGTFWDGMFWDVM